MYYIFTNLHVLKMSLNISIPRCIFSSSRNLVAVPIATYCSQKFRTIDDANLNFANRETGYRSSFNGIVCTVFGGNGFIGRNIVHRLGKYGTQIVIPYRCELYDTFDLKTVGDLGQVQFTDFHLADEDSIRKAVKYSNVVINLIGKDHDTRNFTLAEVNTDGARRIARICREMGVKKLIHVSALNASPNPKPIALKGGSEFYKSKWYGEQAVREEFPDAIIVRPSDVYGCWDRFITYYGVMLRLVYRRLYLWAKGYETIKQPVFVWDVASGLYELVKRHPHDVAGKTYQFVGPRAYILHDLCLYLYEIMRKDKAWGFEIEDARLNLCFRLWRLVLDKVYILERNHLQTLERFEREHVTDEIDENGLTLRDLGVNLINFEDICYHYILPFRAPGDYIEEVYEVPLPPGPKIIRQI